MSPLVATAEGVIGIAAFAFVAGLALGLAAALIIWRTPSRIEAPPPPHDWSRP
jgi:hypothetical protein